MRIRRSFKKAVVIGRTATKLAAAQCMVFSMLSFLILFATSPLALALDPTKPLNQYGLEVWRDDLPQNTVHTIVQTRDGYLWFGTYEGLVRFNGVEFLVFDKSNTPEIRNNGIRALFEDADGTLWIGTASGGLVARRGRTFTAYTTDEGLANNFVYAICQDRKGGIWIGTNGGLSRFADGRFTNLTVAEGLSSDKVRAVFEDRSGDLWVGTDTGLDRYREGRFETFTADDGLGAGSVTSIVEDGEGRIWVGTDGGGVSVFESGRFRTFTTTDGLTSDRVWALLPIAEGGLWIGTDGGGLNRYRGGAFTAISVEEGLSDSYVRSLFKDREGSLWLGTNGGLNRLKDGKFTAFTRQHGLTSNFARVVCEDTVGTVWIGTDGGGLNRLSDGRITALTTKDGLPDDFVRALWPDRDGSLWVGTSGGGMSHLRDGRFTTYGVRDGLANDDVRALFQDSTGAVWAGTAGGGVSRLHEGRFSTYTVAEGLGSNDVRAIAEDRAGGIWIGTNGGGVSRLHDGGITTYRTDEGLASNVVFSIVEDADGYVWIGTSDGLSVFRDGRFRVLRTRDGLYDDIAFQILPDENDHLWMSCNKGVYRVDRKELLGVVAGRLTRVTCSVFGRADGMGSNQCNGASQPAGWRSNDGRLWFPTVNGVSVIDANNIKVNLIPPPVAIDHVIVDGRLLSEDAGELPPSSDRFEFHYDGLSFLVPSKVRFQYMLEGLDGDWIDAGTRRVAYFNNLPPGSYTFRVRASNNDGVWSEEGASFRFDLPPPLWRRWWAIGLYAVFGAGLVVGIAGLRTRALRRRNEMLEAEVLTRTRQLASSEQRALEASRSKSVFLANMSHELRTPLNAILGFVQLMQRDGGLSQQHRKNLGTVERSGEHLLSLIDDVLSIAKIEAGRVTLNEQTFDAHRMLEGLHGTFRLRAQSKGLRFDVDVASEFPHYVRGDEAKVRQILINLLGNAFKFTETGGVILRATWADGRAIFEVEDTGCGIDKSEVDRLFEAFVQTTSGVHSQEGTGLGLAISRNFARLMDGGISVESEPGRGSTFRVEIALPSDSALSPEPVRRKVVGLEAGQPAYRLLVVDNSPENRELLVQLLESVGFEVHEATTGEEAIEIWEAWRPHLIWMDTRMPALDGFQATREIRRLEDEQASTNGGDGAERVRIVALTASFFEHERGSYLDAGFDELVTKPYRTSSIFEKLAEQLGVRFEYERTGHTARLQPIDRSESPPLPAEELTDEQLATLGHAAEVGDVEMVHRAIDRISDVDGVFGEAMREYARRYEFEEIFERVRLLRDERSTAEANE